MKSVFKKIVQYLHHGGYRIYNEIKHKERINQKGK